MKNKRKKKTTLNCTNGRNYPLKLSSLLFLKTWGIYRQRGHQGGIMGPHVEPRHVAPPEGWETQFLSCFCDSSGAACIAPGCAAFCCTPCFVPAVGLSKFAPRFGRSSFQKSIAIFVGFRYHQMNRILGFFVISCHGLRNI